jgi:hypothetical protein
MLYMLWPAGHGPATVMPGMSGTAAAVGNPALALVLALFMLGYMLWTTDRLTALLRARAATVPVPVPVSGPTLAPRLAACYKIAMSIGMGYMLVTML